ncbi:hypothetical protein DAPPUDRAFT_265416 [Daphnia pulex]|uniref:Uncharacterized protein n=1 Tax=Daphnia pulex TaxID=6669 RepID=E9HTE5_DAPPU|nr:hypothetical protein DAPPUDRAFT_265416 [Daphnia pulex]|eukprot:EFX64984.1 hypothetical protein DAPPUDRAFT_265416 [Daphnia pulex]
MVLAKKRTRGRGRRDDTPSRTPTPGRGQNSPLSPAETVRQDLIRQNLRDRSRRPVTMPSSSSPTNTAHPLNKSYPKMDVT